MPKSDLYGGGDDEPMGNEASAGAEQPDKEQGEESETALIPKSLLAGKEFKPGDEVVLKIVQMFDDDVEVAYATGKDEAEPKSQRDESMEQMAAMGTEGE